MMSNETNQKILNKKKQMANLNLWKAVQTTDLAFTKPSTSGRSITTIDPQYQLREATNQFGPFGIGWGIKPDTVKISYKTIATYELLMYDAVMFYNYEDKEGLLNISSVQKIAYVTNNGKGYLKVDDDAQRKAETNAVSKGLSRIGFNADIFLGMFEDQDYVDQIAVEQAIEKSEDKEGEIEAQRGEIKKFMEKSIEAYNVKEICFKDVSRLYKKDMIYLNNRSSITHLTKSAQYAMKELEKAYVKIKDKKDEA